MKHQLKEALTVVAAVATSLGLLGGVASLTDHEREAHAHSLLAESIVAAALHANAGAR